MIEFLHYWLKFLGKLLLILKKCLSVCKLSILNVVFLIENDKEAHFSPHCDFSGLNSFSMVTLELVTHYENSLISPVSPKKRTLLDVQLT